MKNTHKIRCIAILGVLCATLSGCSATHDRHLSVETKMSTSIFIDPMEDAHKVVLVQVKNVTDVKNVDFSNQLKEALQTKGYTITENVKEAHLMIQANIVSLNKNTARDPFDLLVNGYGGAIAGGMVGSLASGASREATSTGMLLGGIIGTVMSTTVESVRYSMVTDVQISEKTQNSNSIMTQAKQFSKKKTANSQESGAAANDNWKRYQTRVMSLAQRVNLKLLDAAPKLLESTASSIAGLL